VLAPDGLKQVRRLAKKFVAASMTSWGTVLVATETHVKVLGLPDISIKSVFKRKLEKGDFLVVIPGEGFVVIGELHLRVFLSVIDRDPIYHEEPPVNFVLAFFGKKKPTQQEVDDGFHFRRKPVSKRQIAQTIDIMQ
jgi:hypothetical protein